jgi:hypothetical protein
MVNSLEAKAKLSGAGCPSKDRYLTTCHLSFTLDQVLGKLVFKQHPLLASFFFHFLRHGFDPLLHAMHGAVYLMVLIKKLGKMSIRCFEFMDFIFVLGKFSGQFVWCMRHSGQASRVVAGKAGPDDVWTGTEWQALAWLNPSLCLLTCVNLALSWRKHR